MSEKDYPITDQPLIDYMIDLLNRDGINSKERVRKILINVKEQGRGFEKLPLKAIHHIHKASMNGGVCVRCECESLVFYSENYVDYYCHNCGRKIDWSDIENNYSEFIRKHEEMLKQVAKLLDDIMEDEDEED